MAWLLYDWVSHRSVGVASQRGCRGMSTRRGCRGMGTRRGCRGVGTRRGCDVIEDTDYGINKVIEQ